MKCRFSVIWLSILILWPSPGLTIDWRTSEPFDENTPVGKAIRNLDVARVGEWGYQTFPLLAEEIHHKNIVRRNKRITALTPYQLKWLGPWLTKWNLNAADIGVVYDAALLNNYKIYGKWPITLMDEYEGQTFGQRIYIRRPYQAKDGNLLVLLSHEAFHAKQYKDFGSIAEFGRQYVTAFLEAFLSYRNNRLEKEAYQAEAEFRRWLCTQEGWRCD